MGAHQVYSRRREALRQALAEQGATGPPQGQDRNAQINELRATVSKN